MPSQDRYHETRMTAPPLVLDVMELFRAPRWESPLVICVNRGQQTVKDDFQLSPGQIWLSKKIQDT